VITDQDTLIMIAAGLLAIWWLVKHPAATKAIGVVVLIGLVCLGVAHPRREDRATSAEATGRRTIAGAEGGTTTERARC
jgi:hypothetical protein